MILAIVDGTNAVMRRAMVQTDLPPSQIIHGTVLNIGDFVKFTGATHLIVAFDSKDSWRRELSPTYKADRTVNTAKYAHGLLNALAQRGVRCIGLPGYEADDVIAAYATKAAERCSVVTLSSDKDLWALATPEHAPGVAIAQYKKGGGFEIIDYDTICDKLTFDPRALPWFHALVGGKNGVEGVKGVGKTRAARICYERPKLEDMPVQDIEAFLQDVKLLTLCTDAAVPSVAPNECKAEKIFG